MTKIATSTRRRPSLLEQAAVVEAELSGRLQDAVQVVVEEQQRHAHERQQQRPVGHVVQHPAGAGCRASPR